MTTNASGPPQLGATPFTAGEEAQASKVAAPTIVRKSPMTTRPIHRAAPCVVVRTRSRGSRGPRQITDSVSSFRSVEGSPRGQSGTR